MKLDELSTMLYWSYLLTVLYPCGSMSQVAARFETSRQLVWSVWEAGLASMRDGAIAANVDYRRVGRCGRKGKDSKRMCSSNIQVTAQDGRDTHSSEHAAFSSSNRHPSCIFIINSCRFPKFTADFTNR